MIRYSLRCERGHAFESWFQSSSAYDSQHKRGLVACPICESAKVDKAIMAPRIARKSKSKSAPEPVVAAPAEDTAPASLVILSFLQEKNRAPVASRQAMATMYKNNFKFTNIQRKAGLNSMHGAIFVAAFFQYCPTKVWALP